MRLVNGSIKSKGSRVSWLSSNYLLAFFLKGLSMTTQNLTILSVPVDIRTRHLPISCHDESYLLVQLKVLLPKHHKWEIILVNNLVIVTACLRTFLPEA